MSLTSEIVNNLNNLVQSSLEGNHKLEWISYSDIVNVQSAQIDNISFAIRANNRIEIMLLLLGNSKECAPTLVSKFAKIYSVQ